jgi:hypothetical protein
MTSNSFDKYNRINSYCSIKGTDAFDPYDPDNPLAFLIFDDFSPDEISQDYYNDLDLDFNMDIDLDIFGDDDGSIGSDDDGDNDDYDFSYLDD